MTPWHEFTMTHDQNFHNLIVDYPRSAVEFFAAEEAEGITSDARVIPVGEEQLKDRLGDRFHEVDAPMLLEWPDGKRKAIVFLFEEETEPRHFSIHRLGRYCLHLGELLETDRIKNDYYTILSKDEKIRYKEEYLPKNSRKEDIIGLRAMWLEEGREEGIQTGERSLFRKLLSHRFGSVPAWTEDRLKNAKQNDIEIWSERILDAKTIDEIFDGQGA